MRTLREFFGGGDLLHLALVLSLLRVDLHEFGNLRHNLHNRMENDFLIRQRVNPISQKVIDDLSELGQYGSIRPPGPLEIAAFVLNTETNLFGTNGGPGRLSDMDDDDDDINFDQDLMPPLEDAGTMEDLDSGVSDVGQISDCETDGSRSPDNLNFPIEFPELLSPASSFGMGDDGPEAMAIAGPTSSASTIGFRPVISDDNLDMVSKLNYPSVADTSFDGIDWMEIESIALQENLSDPSSEDTNILTEGNTENNNNNARASRDRSEPPFDWDEFTLDEEDVENQLIQIDNRLSSLDGSIVDVTDGVRQLGEQLATVQTEEAVEALLDEDEVDQILLASLSGPDPETSLDFVTAIGSDFDPFDDSDWPMESAASFDELFSSVAATVAVDTPLAGAQAAAGAETPSVGTIVKRETPTSPSPEKQKPIKKEIKEEPLDEIEEDLYDESAYVPSHLWNHTYASAPASSRSSTSSSSYCYKNEFTDFYYGAGAMALPSPATPGSSRVRESRDERKARELGIHLDMADIVDSSIEQFKELLANSNFSDEQISLCKAIRRRGKNKVVAQYCRKKKIELISSLRDDLNHAQRYKENLLAEHQELSMLRAEWSEKLRQLEEAILRGMNKDIGNFALSLAAGGSAGSEQQVAVVKRHASATATSSELTEPPKA